MRIWKTMKRLNDRYDEWSMQTAQRIIANLDHPATTGTLPDKRHYGIWDLLTKRGGPETPPK